MQTRVRAIRVANDRAQEWSIPSWWTLCIFDNDTYTLTRVDGIVLGSYKTQMHIWGWRLLQGEEQFTNEWEDGTIIEAAGQYPRPGDLLFNVDQHYPVET